MMKKASRNRFWLVVVLSLLLLAPSTDAFAWDRGRSHHEVVMVGHKRYHFHDGRFYRPGRFEFEIAVFTPPIGAIVAVLPGGHRTTVVGGATYFYYDNVYYTACPSGYIVVPAPVVSSNVVAVPPVAQPQTLSGETVTINVPNANGSYTPVTLVKHNNGYIGPQGEYYPGHPTVEQLKALYGK